MAIDPVLYGGVNYPFPFRVHFRDGDMDEVERITTGRGGYSLVHGTAFERVIHGDSDEYEITGAESVLRGFPLAGNHSDNEDRGDPHKPA